MLLRLVSTTSRRIILLFVCFSVCLLAIYYKSRISKIDRILTDYFISFQFILRHINHEISDFLDTEVDIKSTRYQINLETQKMQSNLYSVRSHLLFYIYIILYWYTFKNSQKLIFINEIHHFFV